MILDPATNGVPDSNLQVTKNLKQNALSPNKWFFHENDWIKREDVTGHQRLLLLKLKMKLYINILYTRLLSN
jgi:hypothetical protein